MKLRIIPYVPKEERSKLQEGSDENEQSVSNILNDWCKLINKQKINEDTWTIIPQLPQYRFKNLQIKNDIDESNNEITITYTYDEWKGV